MARIIDIEGVGESMAEKLASAGVDSINDLLAAAGSRDGREALAAKSGISETYLLKWVNHADLMRIDGVGGQFAELLEATGVDSCAELAQRNPANLAAAIDAANQSKNLTNRTPSEGEIAGWIEQARSMAKVVTH